MNTPQSGEGNCEHETWYKRDAHCAGPLLRDGYAISGEERLRCCAKPTARAAGSADRGTMLSAHTIGPSADGIAYAARSASKGATTTTRKRLTSPTSPARVFAGATAAQGWITLNAKRHQLRRTTKERAREPTPCRTRGITTRWSWLPSSGIGTSCTVRVETSPIYSPAMYLGRSCTPHCRSAEASPCCVRAGSAQQDKVNGTPAEGKVIISAWDYARGLRRA